MEASMSDIFSPPQAPAPPPVRPDPLAQQLNQQAAVQSIQNLQSVTAADQESLLSRYGALLGLSAAGSSGPVVAPVISPTSPSSGGLAGRGISLFRGNIRGR